MSKRDTGASLNTYIEEGFLPEAVRNYLCLLGWSPKDDREKIELDEVVRLFELEKIHRKNASFDLAKCTWLNGEYARELSDERFHALAPIALARAGIDTSKFPEDYVQAALETCKGKVRIFSELPAYGGFYFTDEITLPARRRGETFHRRKTSRDCRRCARRSPRLENFDAISSRRRSRRPPPSSG